MNKQTIERFWAKVQKTKTCWLWTASKRNKGYGAFVWADAEGKVVQGRAHRFAYELLIGPIPPGICVLHTCDNPACVNPDHLWLGSKADNNADMCNKGRHGKAPYPCIALGTGAYRLGEDHHNAILTEAQVKAMRKDKRQGLSYSKLAAKYHVAMITAYKAVKGITWKWLTSEPRVE